MDKHKVIETCLASDIATWQERYNRLIDIYELKCFKVIVNTPQEIIENLKYSLYGGEDESTTTTKL